MACYHPVTLYKSRMGPDPKTGKWPLVSLNDGYRDRPQKVPCGRCDGCLLERARQWSVRCMHEAQLKDENCFITLTYRQDELIYGGNGTGTLYPRHLTLFWKRLRKEFGDGIRYFACGEYGRLRHRPHYHAAVFGLDFPDKQFKETTEAGFDTYNSDILNRIWSHGDCSIGQLTFESASYIARYTLKKKYGQDAEYYEREGIVPEFVRMSRGSKKLKTGGIGKEWYNKFKGDLYPHGYAVVRGGIKSSIPRFYENMYDKENPEELKKIKEMRKDELAKKWEDNTPHRLRIRERVKKSQIIALQRKLE